MLTTLLKKAIIIKVKTQGFRLMVLFISRTKRYAVDAANLFKKLQIVAYGTDPRDALSEISPQYHAVVLINPEQFPDYQNYIDRIHAYDSDMPVFALSDHPELLPHPERFADIASNDIRSADLVYKIWKYASKHDKYPIGIYKAGYLKSIADIPYMTFHGIRIDFTKTQKLIIRYLMATTPFPQNSASILKYAYPPSKRPDIITIRNHISTINKVFKKKFPSIDLIINIPKVGYRIMTPLDR